MRDFYFRLATYFASWRSGLTRHSRLLEEIRLRDEMVCVAAHELRTPITILKLRFELMSGRLASLSKGHELGDFTDFMGSSMKEIDRLERMIRDLTEGPGPAAGLRIKRLRTDLALLTEGLVRRFSDRFEAAGCAVEFCSDAEMIGFWDPVRIEQAISNLLINAIKYAPGKPVRIELRRKGVKAVLYVQDQGDGIPTGEESHVLERFRRGTNSVGIEGHGLGLYIAKRIIEAHGGILNLERFSRGARFTINLPLDA